MRMYWYLESGDYTLIYGEGNAYHQLGTGISVHRRIRSAVNHFIRDRVYCITLNGRWCDISVVNVHSS